MNRQKIKVEVWSDIVCPFCYIGKQKLERAIYKLNLSESVDVIWHSFQLDPGFPKNTAIPSAQYLSDKKGYPPEQLQGMYIHLSNQGAAYNIDFQFDRTLSFNTFNAHRLWQWSMQYGRETELKSALFKAYFTDGIDLSESDNLLKVIADIGLDRDLAMNILTSDSFAQVVEQDISQARQMGIHGVPYFLINEDAEISGAQPDHIFEKNLSTALNAVHSMELSSKSEVCLPDGEC